MSSPPFPRLFPQILGVPPVLFFAPVTPSCARFSPFALAQDLFLFHTFLSWFFFTFPTTVRPPPPLSGLFPPFLDDRLGRCSSFNPPTFGVNRLSVFRVEVFPNPKAHPSRASPARLRRDGFSFSENCEKQRFVERGTRSPCPLLSVRGLM